MLWAIQVCCGKSRKNATLYVKGVFDVWWMNSEMHAHVPSQHELLFLPLVTGINLKLLVVSFGHYLKFYVKKDSIQQPTSSLPNAFQFLMSSEARQKTQTLPSSIAQPRSKKEELPARRRNRTMPSLLFARMKLWRGLHLNEVSSGVADSTVTVLSGVLWYMDGQHTKLSFWQVLWGSSGI